MLNRHLGVYWCKLIKYKQLCSIHSEAWLEVRIFKLFQFQGFKGSPLKNMALRVCLFLPCFIILCLHMKLCGICLWLSFLFNLGWGVVTYDGDNSYSYSISVFINCSWQCLGGYGSVWGQDTNLLKALLVHSLLFNLSGSVIHILFWFSLFRFSLQAEYCHIFFELNSLYRTIYFSTQLLVGM